jgi:PAS domain S-box-containing protein
MTEYAVRSSGEVVVNLSDKGQMRVLHVDDEPALLRIVKQCLEMQGSLQVDTAVSSEEAVKKLEKETYDVIVCDYQMRGKDGLELLKELREKGNNIPFIMFTGKGREEVAIKALNLGADQYLNKTGDPETVYTELGHSIKQAVERKRAQERITESEERYRNLFELAPDAIVTVDLKGVITSCNSTTTALTGYSKDEMVGKHFLKIGILEVNGHRKFMQLWRSALKGRLTKPVELAFRRKDGTTLLAEVRVGFLREHGKITGIQALSTDVTERKNAEKVLRESEEKFITIIENSQDLIMLTQPGGIISYLSPACHKVLGYDPQDLLGKQPRLVHPEEREKVKESRDRALKGEAGSSLEYRIQTKTGETKWIHHSWSPIITEGQPRLIASVVRDITQSKQAEEVLRKSEEQARRLLEFQKKITETPLVWIDMLDKEGNITLWNRAAEIISGYSREEVVGHGKIWQWLYPDQQYCAWNLARAKKLIDAKGCVEKDETTITCKDGKQKTITWYSNSITDENGNPSGSLAVGIDITEQRLAEKAIQENQRKFQALFRDNPEASCHLDSNFHILDINPRFEAFFGYSLEEIKGKHIDDIVVPKEKAEEGRMLDTKAKEGYVYFDTTRRRKDGTPVAVSISAAPITVENRLAGYIGIYKDISELKNSQKKLETMNEKLRVVGSLTRHDVQNKLSVIAGNIFLSKKRMAGNIKALQSLEDMEAACKQIVRILDFAKGYEMLGVEELIYIDVEETIQKAASLFSDPKGTQIVNQCHGLTVLADSLLRQLFYNLIDNSLKYGEKANQIQIYYEKAEGNQLKLVYQDNGIGISPDVKTRLFTEGFTTGKGSGHGLYLIKKTTEVYGWTIQETGQHGKGAQFTMTIPRANPHGKENYRISKQC